MGAVSVSNHKSNQVSEAADSAVVGGGVVVIVVIVVVSLVMLAFILSIRSFRKRISRRRRRRSLWGPAAAPVLSTLRRLLVFTGMLVTSLGLFLVWAMIC